MSRPFFKKRNEGFGTNLDVTSTGIINLEFYELILGDPRASVRFLCLGCSATHPQHQNHRQWRNCDMNDPSKRHCSGTTKHSTTVLFSHAFRIPFFFWVEKKASYNSHWILGFDTPAHICLFINRGRSNHDTLLPVSHDMIGEKSRLALLLCIHPSIYLLCTIEEGCQLDMVYQWPAVFWHSYHNWWTCVDKKVYDKQAPDCWMTRTCTVNF